MTPPLCHADGQALTPICPALSLITGFKANTDGVFMTTTRYMIRVDAISPNRRIVYSSEVITKMCALIRTGQYEPIEVWFDGERFRILDGEKRYRACKRLKMAHIEAVIKG